MRAHYRNIIGELDPERFIFIDESGCHLAMTRAYARSRRGKRAVGSAPYDWGGNVTLIGALSATGMVAAMSIRSGTCSDVFMAFIEQVLVPKLTPGQIVIMDNLAVHKIKAVTLAIEAVGAEVKFLPPYSPDLNPIEQCWSKIKHIIKSLEARTQEALDEAISHAMGRVTRSDAAGWFKHSGYQFN